MKKEELIGKKVYGFKFPDGYAELSYLEAMNHFIGKIGVINSVDRTSVKVVFPMSDHSSRNDWWYPKSLVIANLLTEPFEKKEHRAREIFKIL